MSFAGSQRWPALRRYLIWTPCSSSSPRAGAAARMGACLVAASSVRAGERHDERIGLRTEFDGVAHDADRPFSGRRIIHQNDLDIIDPVCGASGGGGPPVKEVTEEGSATVRRDNCEIEIVDELGRSARAG